MEKAKVYNDTRERERERRKFFAFKIIVVIIIITFVFVRKKFVHQNYFPRSRGPDNNNNKTSTC